MDCNQRSFERGQSSRSTSRAKKIENQNTEDRAKRSPQYNRVRVEDLLNEEQAGTSDSSTSPNSKNVACTEEGCGKRFFTEKSLLVHQKRSHAAPTDFVCHLCQSSFSSIPNLNKHIRSVHDKVRPHECMHCRATFAFRDGLQRHVQMVHDQNRPFSCTCCSMKFKTKAHLNKHHMTIHPGVKLDHSHSTTFP